MFKIVDGITDPVKMFVAPGVRFEPGCIVEFKEIDGIFVADLSRNGATSVGIISESIFIDDDKVSLHPEDRASVFIKRMVFRTNNCEPGDYRTGDKLYVSSNGLFTLEEPQEDSPFVGRVISKLKKDNVFEALWL